MVVAEDEELVGACFEEFSHVAVHRHFLLFSCIVNVFLFCVFEVGVLVRERAFLAHDGVVGLEDAGVEGALSVLGSHVLHDCKAKGELLHVLHLLGILALLVFGCHPEACGIELGGNVHLVLELVALCGDGFDFGVCHTNLLLDLGVLLMERLVDAVE